MHSYRGHGEHRGQQTNEKTKKRKKKKPIVAQRRDTILRTIHPDRNTPERFPADLSFLGIGFFDTNVRASFTRVRVKNGSRHDGGARINRLFSDDFFAIPVPVTRANGLTWENLETEKK